MNLFIKIKKKKRELGSLSNGNGLKNSLTLFLILFLMLFFSDAVRGQQNIIFDTDIGSDCDDAGALAVLHKLADYGEVNILGVIFSSNRNKFGVGVCDAINTYYGRGDIPLGIYQGDPVGDPRDHYSKEIAKDLERFQHSVVDSTQNLLTAYKEILKKQPESSVTIVTVGHPHGLLLLLQDSEGMKLVKEKVKEWVAMAYTGDTPRRGWNFGRNGSEHFVKDLLSSWPTPMYFSSAGSTILTGNKKLPKTPKNNPVRVAYENWQDAIDKGRSSWDQIAVLFAVRKDLFEVDSRGSLVQTPEKKTFWNVDRENQQHHRVTPLLGRAELQELIEELMGEMPLNKS